MLREISGLFIVIALLAIATNAQDRKEALAKLRQAFEGKKVIVKVDMPATREGIDIRPEKSVAIDSAKYQRRLADYGTAIQRGETVVVTMVELGGDDLEFHLNGGGYGSGGDIPNEPAVPIRPVPLPKSQRELDVEKQLETETSRARIDFLRSELNRERDRREDDDRRAMDEFERRTDERAAIIRDRRLLRGSRFIIRFSAIKTATVTPEMVMGYLADYIDFSPINGAQTPSKPEITAVDGDKPYAGEWRNGRGETLKITDDSVQFGDSSRLTYREVFRVSDARLYIIEFAGRDGAKNFVLATTGDGDLKLRFYESLADLQRGSNVRGEEVWRR